MRRTLPAFGLCCSLLAAGCSQLRMPTLGTGSPAAERYGYSRHDPLPDTTLGPATNARPRDADIQRGETRRTREATVSPTQGPILPPGVEAASSADTYPHALNP